MNHTLVVYFSASGKTEKVAKNLAEAIGADLHQIKPTVPYTKEDLNWMNKKSRTSIEMNDKSFRPEVEDDTLDLSHYETIYLGFPIWWYVAPTIVNTFLEKHDFSGKKIVLFATSGSSGFSNTADELKSSVSESTTIIEGKVFHLRKSASYVKKWVESLL